MLHAQGSLQERGASRQWVRRTWLAETVNLDTRRGSLLGLGRGLALAKARWDAATELQDEGTRL